MKTKRRINKKNNLTKKTTNYYSIPSDVSFAAEAVSNNPTSTNMKRFVSKITTNIKRNKKSFSPEINAKLKTLTRAARSNIFGCGASTALKRTKTSGSMRIGVGSRKNNTHKCVDADSKSGQKALLRNFASQKRLLAILSLCLHKDMLIVGLIVCLLRFLLVIKDASLCVRLDK